MTVAGGHVVSTPSVARRQIRALVKPAGVRADVWARVIKLLSCIAGYLPDPWPSERTLAAKLGWHRSLVRRTVTHAKTLGLVTTEPHGKGYRYILIGPISGVQTGPTSAESGPMKWAQKKRRNSYVVPPRSFLPSVRTPDGGSAAVVIPFPKGSTVPRFDPSQDDPETSIGEDPTRPPGASRQVKVNPASRLAVLFERSWYKMTLKHPKWRMIGPGPRGQIMRCTTVMAQQVDIDVAEAYIEAFPEMVASGEVELGEDRRGNPRSPISRFQSWWYTADLDDPREKAARIAKSKAAIAAYKQWRRDQGLPE